MKSFTLCFFLVALFFMVSIPASHSSVLEDTCRKTPNYDLCINSLKDFAGTPTADVRNLAVLSVVAVETKAKEAIVKIIQLEKGGSSAGLNSCGSKYNVMLFTDIPSAIQALQNKNPKPAEDGVTVIANKANDCEKDSPGKLTAENKAIHDVAEIARAIIRLLL